MFTLVIFICYLVSQIKDVSYLPVFINLLQIPSWLQNSNEDVYSIVFSNNLKNVISFLDIKQGKSTFWVRKYLDPDSKYFQVHRIRNSQKWSLGMFILDEKISLERLASFSSLDFSHNLNIEAHSKDTCMCVYIYIFFFNQIMRFMHPF